MQPPPFGRKIQSVSRIDRENAERFIAVQGSSSFFSGVTLY